MTEDLTIVEADWAQARHREAFLALMDEYAREPIIRGAPLADDVRRDLVEGLRRCPNALVFLAFCGERPAAMAVCFVGFSTFAARPLMNIHDLAVAGELRGRRIGERMLAHLEARARQLGCCKITLEVKQDNHGARRLYQRCGFGGEEAVYFETKALD